MSTETATLPRPSRGQSHPSAGLRFNSRGPRRVGPPSRGAPAFKSVGSDWTEEVRNEDAEEVAELKIRYAQQLKTLKEVFPDWTVEDLVFALQEVDGDLPMATDRIAGGSLLHLFVAWLIRSF